MCLGHCVSEDYTPHGIGNYNAIVQEANSAIYKQYQKFLEDLHYVGYSNFDMKYDERDGKYKVFRNQHPPRKKQLLYNSVWM